MKNVMLLMTVLLASCSTSRLTTNYVPDIIPITDSIQSDKNYEVRMDYTGIHGDYKVFHLQVYNQSDDTLVFDPVIINASIVSEFDSLHLLATNATRKIASLEEQKSALINAKNPYSLEGKSVKEIAREGLISGTIGLLTGQSGEELNQQRLDNEYDWDQDRDWQLNYLNEELIFWRQNTLVESLIPPQQWGNGAVMFRVSKVQGNIQMFIPLPDREFRFDFRMVD